MRPPSAIMLLVLPLAACARPGPPPPSLAPRAAELVDPRVPAETAAAPAAVDPALAARLGELVARARAGHSAFEQAAANAQRLIAFAGAPQSESWITAQQAISAAVAARAPTTRAMGDIDQVAAAAIAEQGWIPPADQAAIEAAADQVGTIEREQAARIDAMRARLGP